GGCYVAWFEVEVSRDYKIYVQRLTAEGSVAPGWPDSGMLVCGSPGLKSTPVIDPDGRGGAVVAWFDHRSGAYEVYAQRILPGPAAAWTADGVRVGPGTYVLDELRILSDSAGGGFLTWMLDSPVERTLLV